MTAINENDLIESYKDYEEITEVLNFFDVDYITEDNNNKKIIYIDKCYKQEKKIAKFSEFMEEHFEMEMEFIELESLCSDKSYKGGQREDYYFGDDNMLYINGSEGMFYSDLPAAMTLIGAIPDHPNRTLKALFDSGLELEYEDEILTSEKEYLIEFGDDCQTFTQEITIYEIIDSNFDYKQGSDYHNEIMIVRELGTQEKTIKTKYVSHWQGSCDYEVKEFELEFFESYEILASNEILLRENNRAVIVNDHEELQKADEEEANRLRVKKHRENKHRTMTEQELVDKIYSEAEVLHRSQNGSPDLFVVKSISRELKRLQKFADENNYDILIEETVFNEVEAINNNRLLLTAKDGFTMILDNIDNIDAFNTTETARLQNRNKQ